MQIIPCKCGYYEIYEHFISGTPNRKHWTIKCRNCNVYISCKKRSRAIELWNEKVVKKGKAYSEKDRISKEISDDFIECGLKEIGKEKIQEMVDFYEDNKHEIDKSEYYNGLFDGKFSLKWDLAMFIANNYKQGKEKELLIDITKMCEVYSDEYINIIFNKE